MTVVRQIGFAVFVSLISTCIATAQGDDPTGAQEKPQSKQKTSAEKTVGELIETLSSENNAEQSQVIKELRKRGDKNSKKLIALLHDERADKRARLAVLNILPAFWNRKISQAVVVMLNDPEPQLRRGAATALAQNTKKGDQRIHLELVNVLNEPSPEVLSDFALAIAAIAAEGSGETLVNLLRDSDRDKRSLQAGIIRAIDRTGKSGVDAVLNLSNSGDRKGLEVAVEAFLSMRSRAAADALPLLLGNYHLDNDQRIDLIRSLAEYDLDPPASLQPLINYLGKVAAKTKTIANAKQLQQAEVLRPVKLAILYVVQTAKTKQPIEAGVLIGVLDSDRFSDVRIAAAKAAAKHHVKEAAPLMAHMLVRGGLRDKKERQALIFGLKTLKGKSSGPILVELLADGEISHSEEGRIKQTDALMALSSVDPPKATTIARQFLAGRHLELQSAAIAALGWTEESAAFVGQQFLARKLPRQLLPQVVGVLNRHAGASARIRKLLAEIRAQDSKRGNDNR